MVSTCEFCMATVYGDEAVNSQICNHCSEMTHTSIWSLVPTLSHIHLIGYCTYPPKGRKTIVYKPLLSEHEIRTEECSDAC